MRRIPDSTAARWLASGPGFDWDAGNSTKSSAKHGVDGSDAESVFSGAFYFGGRIVEPEHDEPRWMATGMAASGRFITVVFTRRGDSIRIISARIARREERKLYAREAGN